MTEDELIENEEPEESPAKEDDLNQSYYYAPGSEPPPEDPEARALFRPGPTPQPVQPPQIGSPPAPTSPNNNPQLKAQLEAQANPNNPQVKEERRKEENKKDAEAIGKSIAEGALTAGETGGLSAAWETAKVAYHAAKLAYNNRDVIFKIIGIYCIVAILCLFAAIGVGVAIGQAFLGVGNQPAEIGCSSNPTLSDTPSALNIASSNGCNSYYSATNSQFSTSAKDKGAIMAMVHQKTVEAWGEQEWPAMKALVTQESSFDPTSKLYRDSPPPPTHAYGLFQFEPQTWKDYHVALTSDPIIQTDAGIRYIKARYGTPTKAWQWHLGHNSY